MGFFKGLKKKKEAFLTKRYENKAKKLKEIRKERIKLEGRAKIDEAYRKEKLKIAQAKDKSANPFIKKAKASIKKKLKENKNKSNYGKGIFY